MNVIPRILYKYLSLPRLDVISSGMIRFTQPSALNDPFELDPVFEEIFSHSELAEDIKTIDFEEIIDQYLVEQLNNLSQYSLTKNQKSAIISDARKAMRNQLSIAGEEYIISQVIEVSKTKKSFVQEKLKNSLNSKTGILSLSEDPLSQPMWGNYAQSSKGFAIGFDSLHPFFNQRISDKDELRHLRKVKYDNGKVAKTMRQIDSDLLVLKQSDWAYEKEWRMLLPLSEADKKFTLPDGDTVHLFKYPIEAVKEVIFGINSEDDQIHRFLLDNENILKGVILKKIVKSGRSLLVTPFLL